MFNKEAAKQVKVHLDYIIHVLFYSSPTMRFRKQKNRSPIARETAFIILVKPL